MCSLGLFCSCVFSPFSIAITSLGEERANIGAFRTFVRFALVWFVRKLDCTGNLTAQPSAE